MPEITPRLAEAFAAIDAANAGDPDHITVDGRREPAALVNGRRMSGPARAAHVTTYGGVHAASGRKSVALAIRQASRNRGSPVPSSNSSGASVG